MATILIKVAVPKNKRKGELLFVAKDGESIKKINKKNKGTTSRVATIPKIKKKEGHIQFVDANGNVVEAPMKNWGKKTKPKAKKAVSKKRTPSKARKSTSTKRTKKK